MADKQLVAILGLASLGLGLGLAVALGLGRMPVLPLNEQYSQAKQEASADQETQVTASPTDRLGPAQIARHFAGRAASPVPLAPAQVIVEKTAQSVPWLVYLGLVGFGDVDKYYFKDTRSNRVVALALGQENTEWLLEKKTSGEFILRIDGVQYSVPFSSR